MLQDAELKIKKNLRQTRLLNMTHMTLAVCMLISRLRVHICCILGSMTHRNQQTHYHANSHTIGIQNFKFLYWFVHKHECAHTASKPKSVYAGELAL